MRFGATTLPLAGLLGLAAGEVGITKLASNYGSHSGSTRLILEGFGFDIGGYEGYIDVRVGNEPCAVDDYKTGSNHLECITPPNPSLVDKDVEISILVQGVNTVHYAAANSFAYRTSATPTVSHITPAAFAGDAIRVEGNFRVSDHDLLHIKLADATCAISDAVASSSSSTGCEAADASQAGRHPLNLIVKPANPNDSWSTGYGLAQVLPSAALVDVQTGLVSSVHIHPKIDSLSTHTSSLKAGHLLSIKGQGFPDRALENPLTPTPVSVTIQGKDCAVRSVTAEEIICAIPAGTASPTQAVSESSLIDDSYDSFTPGGAGLTYTVRQPVSSSTPTSQGLHLGALRKVSFSPANILLDGQDNYLLSGLGFFIAPATGMYSFLCKGDDKVTFELSTNDKKANLKTQCQLINFRSSYYGGDKEQIGAPVSLVKGQKYLYRLTLQEGGNTDFATVGVIMHGAFNKLPGLEGLDRTLHSRQLAKKEVREIVTTKTNPEASTCGVRFQIKVGSKVSGIIQTLSSAAIQNALTQAFPRVEVESGSKAGNGNMHHFVVSFPDTETSVPEWELAVISETNCTLAVGDAPIQTASAADALFEAVPGDWLRAAVPSDVDQVLVKVGGLYAAQPLSSSSFTSLIDLHKPLPFFYSASDVLSYSAPSSGSFAAGASISMTIDLTTLPADTQASDFSLRHAGYTGEVGKDIIATGTSLVGDLLTLTVLSSAAHSDSGASGLNELVHARVGIATTSEKFNILATITSPAPSTVFSNTGGAHITLTGTNFLQFNAATNAIAAPMRSLIVDSVPLEMAIIGEPTNESITFELPSTAPGPTSGSISFGGASQSITFLAAAPATVTAVTPSTVPWGRSAFITLTGTNLNEGKGAYSIASNPLGAPVSVTVAGRICVVDTISADGTSLKCLLRRSQIPSNRVSLPYWPRVLLSQGIASVPSTVVVDMDFYVSSVSTNSIGHHGASISVEGKGFTYSKGATSMASSADVYWHTQYELEPDFMVDIKIPCVVDPASVSLDGDNLFTSFTCLMQGLCEFAGNSGGAVMTLAEEAADSICKKNLSVSGSLAFASQFIEASCGPNASSDTPAVCKLTLQGSASKTRLAAITPSGFGGDQVTLTVQNPPAGVVASDVTLHLGGRNDASLAYVASCTSVSSCTIPTGIPAGVYWARVHYKGAGFAHSTDDVIFTQKVKLLPNPSNEAVILAAPGGGKVISVLAEGLIGHEQTNIFVKVGTTDCPVVSVAVAADPTQSTVSCILQGVNSSVDSVEEISIGINALIDDEDWVLATDADKSSVRKRRLCGTEHDAIGSVAQQGQHPSAAAAHSFRAANKAVLSPIVSARTGSAALALPSTTLSAQSLRTLTREEKKWRDFARANVDFQLTQQLHHAHEHELNQKQIHAEHSHEDAATDADAEATSVEVAAAVEVVDASPAAEDEDEHHAHHHHAGHHGHHRRLASSATLATALTAGQTAPTTTAAFSIDNLRALETIDEQVDFSRRRRLQAAPPAVPLEITASSATDATCSNRVAYLFAFQLQTSVTINTDTIDVSSSYRLTNPPLTFGVTTVTTMCPAAASVPLTRPTTATLFIGPLQVGTFTVGVAASLPRPASLPVGVSVIRSQNAFGGINVAGTRTISNLAFGVTSTPLSYAGGVITLTATASSGVLPVVPSASSAAPLSLFAASGLSGLPGAFALQNQGSVITGTLFPARSDAPLSVKVCGIDCPLLSSSPNTMQCVMPEFATQPDLAALISQGFLSTTPDYVIPHKDVISALPAHRANTLKVFDRLILTGSSTQATNCFHGVDMGEGLAARVHGLKYHPQHGEPKRALVAGSIFEYSNDAITWTELAPAVKKPVEGWNNVDVPTAVVARYFRYRPSEENNSRCDLVKEIRFLGVRLNVAASCPVEITLAGQHSVIGANGFLASTKNVSVITATAPITPNFASMPKVTSVSASNGSAVGGTSVNLVGSSLTIGDGANAVLSGGVATINAGASTATSVSVTTSRRSDNMNDAVSIQFADRGFALVKKSVAFQYQDNWSSPLTWDDYQFPMEDDFVVVPFGQRIILDISPPKLNTLLVQGDLEVARVDGITLQFTYFWMSGGEFHVGTVEQPFTQKFSIIAHGDRYTSIELPYIIGAKVIVAQPNPYTGRKGKLSLHGAPVSHTWLTLAVTASAGSDQIKVDGVVTNWKAGDRIVISHLNDMMKAEELIIKTVTSSTASVLGSSKTVSLITTTTPMLYDHVAQWTNLAPDVSGSPANLVNVYHGCEVGILTRNISIRGDDNSVKQKFGVHMMAQHGALLQVENVELTWCGQQGVVGHYCSHFHMPGSMPEGYVRRNSIHHSFQRAVTIHAVHDATIKENMVFDVCGHTIFIEDANENNNVVEGNLVVRTRKNHVLLPGDMKPACFWTPNPNNIFRNNVAAGSAHIGFWFELEDHPTGPSYTETICPVNEKLGEFTNNRAHGALIGLRIYPQYFPRVNSCEANTPENIIAPQYFEGTISHDNSEGFFHKKVTDIHHRNSAFIDNSLAGTWVRHFDGYYDAQPNFYRTIFQGSSTGIYLPQREFWQMEEVTFKDMGVALIACAECDSGEHYSQGGYTTRFKKIKFINTTTRLGWGSPTNPRKEIMWDQDGSLSGTNKESFITYSYPHLLNDCTALDAVQFLDGVICDSPLRKLGVRSVDPRSFDNKPMHIRTSTKPTTATVPSGALAGTDERGIDVSDLTKAPYRVRGPFSGWTFVTPINKWIHVAWTGVNSAADPDFRQMQVIYSDPGYITNRNKNLAAAAKEWIGITSRHNTFRNRFEVSAPFFNPESVDGAVLEPSLLPNYVVNGQHTLSPSSAPISNLTLLEGQETALPFGSFVHSGEGETGEFGILLGTAHLADHPAIALAPYTVSVKARECPEVGCYAPPPIVQLDAPHLWSDTAAWVRYNSTLPTAGSSVIIKPSQYVIMDVSPPKFADLEIQGKLEFGHAGSALSVTPPAAGFTLSAMNIIVWGILEIGNYETPYPLPATVALWGDKTGKAVIVEEGLFIGSKGITVIGHVIAVGLEVAAPWTTLASTAAPGSVSIRVKGDQASAWLPGQKVSIGGTSFNAHAETETVTIASASTVTNIEGALETEIFFSPALEYSHAALSVTVDASGASTTVSAPVALLERSILFTSAEVDPLGWGWTLNVVAKRPSFARTGSVYLRYVQLDKAGKTSRDEPAINFDFSATRFDDAVRSNVTSTIDASVINCLNIGVTAKHTPNISLSRNIIREAQFFAVEFDEESNSARLNSNLVLGVRRDPDWQDDWHVPYAGFIILAKVTEMTNNMVCGSDDTGYYFRAESCPLSTASASTAISWPQVPAVMDAEGFVTTPARSGPVIVGNSVVGAKVGVIPMPARDQSCKAVTGWTVAYASHIGIMVVDEPGHVQLEDNTVADCHIGFHFIGLHSGNQIFAMRNSLVVGSLSTDGSRCSLDVTHCRAVDNGDSWGANCNSSFKPALGASKTTRRVGIVAALQSDYPKTCYAKPDADMDCRPPNKPERMCSMPWDGEIGVHGGIRATLDGYNTTFANFETSCSGTEAFAVATNPEWEDYTAELSFEKTTWYQTLDGNKVRLGSPDCKRSGFDDFCDASWVFGRDVDGSFLSQPSGGSFTASTAKHMTVPNPATCKDLPAINGVVFCPNLRLRALVMHNMDVDSDRVITPVKMASPADSISYSVAGMQKMEECSLSMYIGNVVTAVFPGKQYDVTFSATNPATTRIYFFAAPGEKILLRIFYVQPLTLQAFINGKDMAPRENDPLPSLTSPHGAHALHPQERVLYLTLEGSKAALEGKSFVDIRTLSTIQISLTANVSRASFRGPDLASNIATLLGISTDRVRVADPNFGAGYVPPSRRLEQEEEEEDIVAAPHALARRLSHEEAVLLNNEAPTVLPPVLANSNADPTLVGDVVQDATLIVLISPEKAEVAVDSTAAFVQVAALAPLVLQAQSMLAAGTFTLNPALSDFILTAPRVGVYSPTLCAGVLKCNGLDITAAGVGFNDHDGTEKVISGPLSIVHPSTYDHVIDGYYVYWGNANGQRIASLPAPIAVVQNDRAAVPAGEVRRSFELTLPTLDLAAPSLVVVAFNFLGESTQSSYTLIKDLSTVPLTVEEEPEFIPTNPGDDGDNDDTDGNNNGGGSIDSASSVLVPVLCGVLGALIIAGLTVYFVQRHRKKQRALAAVRPVDGDFEKLKNIDPSPATPVKSRSVHTFPATVTHPASVEAAEATLAVVDIDPEMDLGTLFNDDHNAVTRLNNWLAQQTVGPRR